MNKALPIFLMSFFSLFAEATIPDFASIRDVKQKKTAFFDYLYPLIVAENKKILRERAILLSGDEKNATKQKKICEKYSKNCDTIDSEKLRKLLRRVDIIPPSLAMAQSANESAWGTSRFAREANNFFGQWCFKTGCGIVPSRRKNGTKHEVRKFASAQASIGSYIFNLNTSKGYKDLRKRRAKLRASNKNPTGYRLAKDLGQYSERREEYVDEIRALIAKNHLVGRYDDKFWVDINKFVNKN